MSKKASLDKANVTKNGLFFLRKLQLITNLLIVRNSYMVWSTSLIYLKLGEGFFIFNSVSFLFSSLYFCSTKSMVSLVLKHNFIQNKKTQQNHTQFCCQTSTRSFKIYWYLHELQLPQNWPGSELVKLRKSKFWVYHFLSIVTSK